MQKMAYELRISDWSSDVGSSYLALAELKSMRVSRRMPQNLVLGCDQTLSLETGEMLDKAENRKDAERILRLLSGKTHYLHSAAVISLAGEPLWRHVERVKMTVRPLSDAVIESYLDADWKSGRAHV